MNITDRLHQQVNSQYQDLVHNPGKCTDGSINSALTAIEEFANHLQSGDTTVTFSAHKVELTDKFFVLVNAIKPGFKPYLRGRVRSAANCLGVEMPKLPEQASMPKPQPAAKQPLIERKVVQKTFSDTCECGPVTAVVMAVFACAFFAYINLN